MYKKGQVRGEGHPPEVEVYTGRDARGKFNESEAE